MPGLADPAGDEERTSNEYRTGYEDKRDHARCQRPDFHIVDEMHVSHPLRVDGSALSISSFGLLRSVSIHGALRVAVEY
jgi:hypothetical protein